VTLKTGLEVVQGRSLKMAPFDRPYYEFLLARCCKYSSIFYRF